MKIEKWLTFAEDPSGFCLPIWTAAQTSAAGQIPSEIRQMGYAATLRLSMLNPVIGRLRDESRALLKHARTHEMLHVRCLSNSGSAVALPVNQELKWQTLADITSLLFEIKASGELLVNFFHGMLNHCGKPCSAEDAGRKMAELLSSNGQDVKWFSRLQGERNFFIHEGTPRLAVDISQEPYELLITRDHLRSFDDDSMFVTLSQIGDIVRGFSDAMPIIQAAIINLLKECQPDDGQLSSESALSDEVSS